MKAGHCIALLFVALGSVTMAAAPLPKTAYDPATAQRYDTGALRRVDLLGCQAIEGYPCRGRVWFWQSGGLQQFTLDQLCTISRVTIPAGSTVFLSEKGTLRQCWFASTTVVRGLPCLPGAETPTVFYPGGGIQWCYLARDTNIRGIMVRGATHSIVGFHPNGRLRSCILAHDAIISGHVYRAGTAITFDHNGQPITY